MEQNRIKAIRKAARITQEELAEKLSVNRATVSKYENGDISLSLEMLRKIAAALNVDWTELVPVDEQCKIVTDYVVEKAGLIVKYTSDEDRILRSYEKLNTDGMLAASKCFLQHLKPEDLKEVADYVEKLTETPQYQRPQETDEDKK
jgi:transcriptional regulator with XRE-family HTH domain|nr:MAG TPA: helix-turn-helix domain protein [Caudoviricetes sp.]